MYAQESAVYRCIIQKLLKQDWNNALCNNKCNAYEPVAHWCIRTPLQRHLDNALCNAECNDQEPVAYQCIIWTPLRCCGFLNNALSLCNIKYNTHEPVAYRCIIPTSLHRWCLTFFLFRPNYRPPILSTPMAIKKMCRLKFWPKKWVVWLNIFRDDSEKSYTEADAPPQI